ncbi:uncharacterized protein METZ01_LOCUS46356, partial [marine metagenome]
VPGTKKYGPANAIFYEYYQQSD